MGLINGLLTVAISAIVSLLVSRAVCQQYLISLNKSWEKSFVDIKEFTEEALKDLVNQYKDHRTSGRV